MTEEQLFHEALEKPAQHRDAFIDAACGKDSGLRQRMEVLLRAHENPGSFLNSPAQHGDIEMPAAESVTEKPGTVIGPYTIREQIGEGGMGIVFVAEQSKPIRRKVALKIIKPGMDTRQVVARFEAERQTLALMDHPNIARVIDGGSTDTGRPYFVMELIHGARLTEYCDELKMTTQERLELFGSVCSAVQHAHQKGIIHRDLKPSNILVTEIDGRPVPKVIDFGVAKATDQQLTEHSIYTEFSQMLGTPMYMSPEQVGLRGVDVDTRSDVYSLGVLLYQLLSGKTPFSREQIRTAAHEEVCRLICEVDPPRPSTRLSTLKAADSITISGQRGVDARQLQHGMQGELDWIVMKALDKDRNCRYQSASALGEDIERYLTDKPVTARPPSLRYHVTKFAQRHKAMIVSITAVFVALVIGTAASLWQASKAISARKLAEDRLVIVQEQKVLAESERQRSRMLLYVSDMKLASDALRDGDIPRVVNLLKRHRPGESEQDLRGFAWRYLKKSVSVSENWSRDGDPSVTDIQISPDGQTLAIATQTGICFREASTGRLLQSIVPGSAVRSVAWHPNGTQFATADEGGYVRQWDFTSDGATVQTTPTLSFEAHNGIAHSVCFTPDGETIASSGGDNTVRTWESATGKALNVFEGHERSVLEIDISPDGTLLASVSSDGKCALWDLKDGTRIDKWSSPTANRMVCVRFSPDGFYLAAGDIYGNLVVADIRSGLSTYVTQLDGIESLMFREDSSRIAVGDRGGVVHIWTLNHSREPRLHPYASSQWPAHGGRVQALARVPETQTIISGSHDGSVACWAPVEESTHWSCSIGYDCEVANDGSLLLCDREVDQFNLDTRRVRASLLANRKPWKVLATAKDCVRIAVAGFDGTVLVYDRDNQTEVARWNRGREPLRVAISPKGQQVAIAWTNHREYVELFNVADPLDSQEIAAPQSRCVVFSPDGRFLAIGSQNDLMLYDLLENRISGRLVGHDTTLGDAAFNADGRIVATVSNDRRLKLWDVATGREISSTEAHGGDILSVTFSPDGHLIATGGDDRLVRVWHTETMQPLMAIETSTKVEKVRFGSGGDRLIVRLLDRHVHVFDASDVSSTPSRAAENVPPVVLMSGAHRTTYALKNSHELWKYNVRTDEFELLDKSLDRKTIPVVSGDFLPYVKNERFYWRANQNGILELAATGTRAAREYIADGDRLFMLKASSQGDLSTIWHIDAEPHDSYVARRIACRPGTKKILAGRGKLYSLFPNGKVYVWDNQTYDHNELFAEPGWTVIESENAGRQIALSRLRLFGLTIDGQVSHLDGAALPDWLVGMNGRIPIHHDAVAIAAHPDSDVVTVAFENGELRRLNLDADSLDLDQLWPLLDASSGRKSISVDGQGRIFAVTAAGQLWQIYPERKQHDLK